MFFPSKEKINNKKTKIDYLGFSFDGDTITIRDKTISKYYYRMYRKLNHIVKTNRVSPTGKRISAENLYKNYTLKGAYPDKKHKASNPNQKHKGNFITYVNRSMKEFGPNESIDRATKNHMLKIKRKLKNIKN